MPALHRTPIRPTAGSAVTLTLQLSADSTRLPLFAGVRQRAGRAWRGWLHVSGIHHGLPGTTLAEADGLPRHDLQVSSHVSGAPGSPWVPAPRVRRADPCRYAAQRSWVWQRPVPARLRGAATLPTLLTRFVASFFSLLLPCCRKREVWEPQAPAPVLQVTASFPSPYKRLWEAQMAPVGATPACAEVPSEGSAGPGRPHLCMPALPWAAAR